MIFLGTLEVFLFLLNGEFETVYCFWVELNFWEEVLNSEINLGFQLLVFLIKKRLIFTVLQLLILKVSQRDIYNTFKIRFVLFLCIDHFDYQGLVSNFYLELISLVDFKILWNGGKLSFISLTLAREYEISIDWLTISISQIDNILQVDCKRRLFHNMIGIQLLRPCCFFFLYNVLFLFLF